MIGQLTKCFSMINLTQKPEVLSKTTGTSNDHSEQRYAYYALRRTLVPWRFEESLRELIDYCVRVAINEVILKIDVEDFSHGMPTVQYVKEYQKLLFRAKEELNHMEVLYSLNPWVTLGHCDRGRRSDLEHTEIEWMVGHDGTQCTAQACPLSPGWRRLFAEIWTMYAETEPHVIWVEDDIRTFNHMPATVGCFCKNHMMLFSQRVGEDVSRERLVHFITAPGVPHPWRKVWLDLMGETMVDTARFIASVIYKVSPKTCIGLMSSGPVNHAVEGRKWKLFAEALKGAGSVLYSRPPLWSYSEDTLKSICDAADSVLHTRAVMPQGCAELSEIDNSPYTAFSKSNIYTFLQMAVSISLGCEGVTMNLYDHCGSPMWADPAIEEMLIDKRAFLDGLASICTNKNGLKGIGVVSCENGAYHRRLSSGAGILDIRPDGHIWHKPLNAFGIPTTYCPASVMAAGGDSLLQFNDESVLNLLKKGLLLDGRAAWYLQERGFRDYIGAHIEKIYHVRSDRVIAAEELFAEDFGGAPRKYVTADLAHIGDDPILMAIMTSQGKGKFISHLVDPDCQPVYPVTNIFENMLGGRVAILAYDLEFELGIGFHNPYRRSFLRSILCWLNRGELDLVVDGENYLLPILMETGDATVAGCFNLSLDDYRGIKFHLAAKGRHIKTVSVLENDGKLVNLSAQKLNISDSKITIEYDKIVSHKMPVFLRIEWH